MIWKKELLLSIGLFFFLTAIIFYPSFLKDQVLFPGNYLQVWFEPYKSANTSNGTLLIAHKPVADDVFRHIYPFKVLAVDMLKNFQLPLWNPYNGAGEPLLATVNSGLVDPFNLLFLLLPNIVAWNSYLFLQLFFIGFFTYWYCRKLQWHPFSSIFSAVVFSLSGVVISRVTLGAYGLGIAMLPLLLWIIESYLENEKTKRLFLIPFAIFSLITSTHPQISFYILAFTFIYLLVRVLNLKKRTVSFLLIPTLFFILGFTLSAIQILPTAELLKYSNLNTETSSYVGKFLVPWYHFVSLFIPNYFGNAATYNFWGPIDYVETVVSIGLIPSFFAYLFIFHSKRTGIKLFYLATFLITCLLAIDSPISRLVLSLPIPILSTDPPSRIFLLTTFSAAILGGGGLEMLINKQLSFIQFIKRSLPFLLFIFAILGSGFYLYKTIPICPPGIVATCHQIALRNTLLETGVFILGFLLFLTYGLTKNKKIKLSILLGIICIVFIIGFYNAEKFLPFSPKSTILPDTTFFQKLQSIKSQGRVFGFGNANVTVNLATYFKIYDPQYYHPLYIRRYGELTAYANYGKYNYDVLRSDVVIRNDLKPNSKEEQRRERLLQLLNVTGTLYNASERPVEASEEPIWLDSHNYLLQTKGLPRAFAVNSLQTQTNSANILLALFNPYFDPKNEAIVEKTLFFKPTKQPLQSNIQITSYQENTVTIHTQTNQPSFLVLLDNDYPGWNAYVDGNQTQVFRTDYTFRGIILPKGNHIVQFVYQPVSVSIGLWVSVLTLLTLGCGFIWSLKSQKKK